MPITGRNPQTPDHRELARRQSSSTEFRWSRSRPNRSGHRSQERRRLPRGERHETDEAVDTVLPGRSRKGHALKWARKTSDILGPLWPEAFAERTAAQFVHWSRRFNAGHFGPKPRVKGGETCRLDGEKS